MSLRQEALRRIDQRVAAGGIYLEPGGGRRARQRVQEATREYAASRLPFLEHELATHFRVAIYGSARLEEGSPYYDFIRDLSRAIVRSTDADIVTGGGPGIMEAAHLGAKLATEDVAAIGGKAGARRIGVTIKTPRERGANPHVEVSNEHPEFSTRLQEFVDLTHAAYIAPGLVGTWLELFNLLQLKQFGHLEREYPIIVHPKFERTFREMFKMGFQDSIDEGTTPLMGEHDLDVIFSDDIPEIVGIIASAHARWYESIGQHVKRELSPQQPTK